MLSFNQNNLASRQSGPIPILPNINLKRTIQRCIQSQNTFQFSKLGISKNKFVNYQLKIKQEADQTLHQTTLKQNFIIPLLNYHGNEHSPYRISLQRKKQPHPLLVSRSLNVSMPSIGTYDISGYQKIKFKKPQYGLILTAPRKDIFQTN